MLDSKPRGKWTWTICGNIIAYVFDNDWIGTFKWLISASSIERNIVQIPLVANYTNCKIKSTSVKSCNFQLLYENTSVHERNFSKRDVVSKWRSCRYDFWLYLFWFCKGSNHKCKRSFVGEPQDPSVYLFINFTS